MVDMYKQVADATAFVRGDGSKLHSLKALEMALLTMPESEFSYHVNSSKNDFANWVGAVFNNKDLAAKLKRSSSRIDMLTVLDEAGRHTHSTATVSAPASQKLQSSVFTSARQKAASTQSVQATNSQSAASARQSRPLHHKLRGIFKKGEKPVKISDEEATRQIAHDAHHTIHAQIEHLDRELAHLTHHHAHTTARENVGEASLEETVKERILDFSLGLIVGLMLGFILAKSLGL